MSDRLRRNSAKTIIRVDLEFKHKPESNDYTHCGLYGPEYNNEVIQDQIAESVREVVSAYSNESVLKKPFQGRLIRPVLVRN